MTKTIGAKGDFSQEDIHLIDLLNKLINCEISEDKAYDIYDEVMEKHDAGQIEALPQDELGLDNYEWTAHAWGISWVVLADWRKNGWPKKCVNCNKPIDYKKYGWGIRDNKLTCIGCDKRV